MSQACFTTEHWHARLSQLAAAQPASAALLATGRDPLSFAALVRQIEGIGPLLRQHGITRASRVAMLMPPGVEAASALLSLMAHAVCVPLNPSMPSAELDKTLRAAGVHALLIPSQGAQAAQAVAASMGLAVFGLKVDTEAAAGSFGLQLLEAPLHSRPSAEAALCESVLLQAAIGPDQAALVLHTSGTTADAKRVVLSHAQLGASAANVAWHLRLQPSDRSLNVMPLFHSHGIVGVLLSSLVSGASVVCLEGFEPQAFCAAVAEFNPTWYSASPTIHGSVLEHCERYRERAPQHRFRFARSTSSALPPAVLERLEQALQAPLIESFGMTEWSQMASNALPPEQRKAGSVGRATGVALALLDAHGRLRELEGMNGAALDGELLVRGEGLASGYDGDVQASAQAWLDGWFRTGDLARVDEDGFLFITGRLKDVLNRGGEKIAPLEIEAALMAHPAVRDAVAFGVPHATLGEDLAAAVVLAPGASTTEADLRDHLLACLAACKVPSTLTLTDAIPRSATGKLKRRDLVQRFGPAAGTPRAVQLPQSPIEHDLHAVFCAVLGRQDIGVGDNFFAIGGDSLSGMRVIGRINKKMGIKLPPATLFRHPSIAALARQIGPVPAPALRDVVDMARHIADLSDEEVMRLLALEEASATRCAA